MTENESRDLLDRNHIGRLCFVNQGGPDVRPVHFVLDDDWIFLRSDYGTKLEALAHHPYVAFEVDEIRDAFDWDSVVARGTVYVLTGAVSPVDRRAYRRALGAIRARAPAALTRDDPTPARQIIYGIHIDSVTGRSARPGAPSPSPSPRERPRRRAVEL